MPENQLANTFAAVPRWLAAEAPPIEIAVYVALAMRVAGLEGPCFPSMATIAREAHVSTKTVQKALKALRRRGAVSWDRPNSTRRSNCYWVRFERSDAEAAIEWDQRNYLADEDLADETE